MKDENVDDNGNKIFENFEIVESDKKNANNSVNDANKTVEKSEINSENIDNIENKYIDIEILKDHPKNNILLPQLTKNELSRLKDRIKKFGFTENIEITKDNVILDGHHRIKILKMYKNELHINKVPYRIIDISEDEQTEYIISKNFDRRQLSKLMQSYIRGKQYNSLKKSRGGDQANRKNFSLLLAEKFGVTSRTISADSTFASVIDKIIIDTSFEFAFDMLNGEIKSNKNTILSLNKQPNNIIEKVFKFFTENRYSEKSLKEIIDSFVKNKNKDDLKDITRTTNKVKATFEIDQDLLDKIKEKNIDINEMLKKMLE